MPFKLNIYFPLPFPDTGSITLLLSNKLINFDAPDDFNPVTSSKTLLPKYPFSLQAIYIYGNSIFILTLLRINIRARHEAHFIFYPRKSMTVSVSDVCPNFFEYSD